MATFIGTGGADTITPQLVSDGVFASGTARPGNAPDILDGGAGDDTLDGGGGVDTVRGGDGNDRVLWNPGGGADVVDGGADADTLAMTLTAAGETVTLSAVGGHADLAIRSGPTVDIDNVELIRIAPLAGGDTVVINDLTTTEVGLVDIDLGVGGAADGQADAIVINGTSGLDWLNVAYFGQQHIVIHDGFIFPIPGDTATMPEVDIENTDRFDKVIINGGLGDDVLQVGVHEAASVMLTLNGDDGNDFITASENAEVLNGGVGNDTILDGGGADTVNGGTGDDILQSGYDHGNDSFDGGSGIDTLDYQVGFQSQQFGQVNVTAQAGHAMLDVDFGQSVLDTNNIEIIKLASHPSQDAINIGDLTGTRVQQINIDLGRGSASDGAPDFVSVTGTSAANVIKLTADLSTGVATISGLPVAVTIAHADGGDTFTVRAADGDDRIDAFGLTGFSVGVVLDGGAGADTIVSPVSTGGLHQLLGGSGNDNLTGGFFSGSFLRGGDGDDTLASGGFNTFEFFKGETGRDVITNFNSHDPTFSSVDFIEMIGFADHSFSDLVSHRHINQVGSDVVISDDAKVIVTLRNIALSALDDRDFIFG